MKKEWNDIDEVPAYLELRRIDDKAFLFCRYLEEALDLFPGENFVSSDLGWITEIAREKIVLRQEALFSFSVKSEEAERRQGAALLPEEERVLFLWQDDGSLVVSSEDPQWSQLLARQSYAEPLLIIERPGSETVAWRIPSRALALL